MNNRFKQGSGVYQCHCCGKDTRDTGRGEAEVEMCARCLFECYVENALADYGQDSQQHLEAVKNLNALPEC